MSDIPKILMSSQYDKFRTAGHNRELHTTEKLEESMIENGFMPSSAIHVKKTNTPGVFEIVRGHHRFSVAKKLKIPFYYIVDESCTDMYVLETIPKTNWSQGDFVEFFANSGDGNYVFLRNFAKEHKITIGCAANLLRNKSGCFGGTGTGVITDLRKGKFQPTETGTDFANKVMSVVDAFTVAGYKRARTSAFISALAEIVRSSYAFPDFKIDWFKKQAKYHAKLKDTDANKSAYILALENLYNYGVPEAKQISFKQMKIRWADYQKFMAERSAAANGKR